MLGSIQALTTADLDGRISPLQGPVSSLQFDAIGPAARIDVEGSLTQLAVNRGVDLGTSGSILVSNDLSGSFSVVEGLTLSGGRIQIGRDLSATVTIGGNLTVLDGGQLAVGRNLGGAVAGSSGGSSGASASTTVSPSGGASASTGATSSGGGVTIAGNLVLAGGGQVVVGDNLGSLSVGGNLDTAGGGEIQVGGNLGTLSIGGFVRGKGTDDIVVGDDLGQWTVLGGGSSGGSVQDVAVAVAKNIQGLDIRNGIFDSLITAGILINGGTPAAGSNGWNIGPDGSAAVFDSQIQAGNEIDNLTIGGDVSSDSPTNPAGRPTRIVAGENAQGQFSPDGVIDNFQIVGSLIDAVLAASVEPLGGFYHEPAGTIEVGFVSEASATASGVPTQLVQNTVIPTSTAPPYANVSDIVLPGGAINPSFAPPLQLEPPNAPAGTMLPMPSKSTVLGNVVTTSVPAAGSDYAGIFAASTSGVIVGPVPTS